MRQSQSLAGLGLSTLKQGLAPPGDAAASVTAALIGILAAFWNVQVVLLLFLVVAGGVVDLWVGARKARIKARLGKPGGFDRAILDEGASGKGAYLAVILFLGIALDSVAVMLGGAMNLGLVDFVQSATPATSGLLAYRLAREMSSITHNVQTTPGGQDVIWPGAKQAIDAVLYRAKHPDADGPVPPQERWGDHISPEEQAWIDEHLSDWRTQRGGEG